MKDHIVLMERYTRIRGLARESLTGKWNTAVLGTILYMALINGPILILHLIKAPSFETLASNAPALVTGSSLISGNISASLLDMGFIDILSNIYSLVVAGPFLLGYIMFMLSLFRNQTASPLEIIYGFERFWKSFGLMCVMNLFIMLWSFLFIIPGFIAYYRYRMAFYILAEYPDMKILDILAESKRLMRFNKWYVFVLDLTFLGWGLLAILTLGVGTFWLTPYMIMSGLVVYEMVNGRSGRFSNVSPIDWEG